MEKSPEAFRTISEVADELDVPKHVLRFWEGKFAQLRPMKRGGGRRYYRPEDVELLRGIRHLLYSDGFTIKGVQKILREQGVHFVMQSWQGPGEEAMGRPGASIPDVAAEAAHSAAHPAARPRPEQSQPATRETPVLDPGSDVTQDLIETLEACRDLLAAARK